MIYQYIDLNLNFPMFTVLTGAVYLVNQWLSPLVQCLVLILTQWLYTWKWSTAREKDRTLSSYWFFY